MGKQKMPKLPPLKVSTRIGWGTLIYKSCKGKYAFQNYGHG